MEPADALYRNRKVAMQTLTAASLAHYTEPALLVPTLSAAHHEAALVELSRQLERAGRIDHADGFVNIVLAHDELAPAVFDGVAFALGRGPMVRELSFAIGLAPQSFHWGNPNMPLVDTVVLIAAPLSDGTGYLAIVPAFCKLLGDRAVFSQLCQSTESEQMLDILRQFRCH